MANVVYKRFDKKIKANVNQVLAQDLHKPVIKKFKRRKVYERFKGNLWAASLAESASSYSKKNHGVKYLLCRRCFL